VLALNNLSMIYSFADLVLRDLPPDREDPVEAAFLRVLGFGFCDGCSGIASGGAKAGRVSDSEAGSIDSGRLSSMV
jgi:hypothetical protein